MKLSDEYNFVILNESMRIQITTELYKVLLKVK